MKTTAAVLVLLLMMTVAAYAVPPGETVSNSLTLTVTVLPTGGGGGGGNPPPIIIPPEPTPGGGVRFEDVSGHWAEDDVNELADAGVVFGYPDGTFRPDAPVTRAEAAVMLFRHLGLDREPVATFPDCVGKWFAGEVGALRSAGVFEGYPDGNFGPDRSITRAELAAVVSRMMALADPSGDGPSGYTDPLPAWAARYIRAVSGSGIFLGYPDGTFRPNASVTRAELCAVICRMARGQ